MKKRVFPVVFLLIFSLALTSAITISEPEDIYNLGDWIYITVDDIAGSDSGNFRIDLECDNETINLLKISARSFSPEGGHTYDLPYKKLTKKDLEIDSFEKVLGTCQITSSVGITQATTKTFTITDELSITSLTDKTSYSPGEEVTLTIATTKSNNASVNGVLKASGAINTETEITAGKAILKIEIPEDAKAGQHNVSLYAYEKSSDGEILNSGNYTSKYNVKQIPTKIQLSLEKTETLPEEDFTIGIDIYDQSDEKMNGAVSALISSEFFEEQITTKISTKEFTTLRFPSNATKGTWTIEASLENLTDERDFEILSYQKTEFDLTSSILTIKNIGNTEYNNTIEVSIGGETKEIDVFLQKGETKKYNLKAPEGEYDVIINDGKQSLQKTSLLTGRAISVDEITNSSIIKDYAVIWIILILILAGLGVVLVLKSRGNKTRSLKPTKKEDQPNKMKMNFMDKIKSSIKNINTSKTKIENKIPKSYSSEVNDTLHRTNKSPESQSLDENNFLRDDNTLMDLTKARLNSAQSALVLKGEKSKAAIIAIKINNISQLTDNTKKELSEIIDVKQEKGLIELKEDEIFIIFSALVTKTFQNEKTASNVAFKIFNKLKEHNKKFANKIKFNIAVHSGDIIASIEKNKQTNTNKLKYTGSGNTITLLKRMAESSEDKLIVSEDVRKKLMRDLRVQKTGTIGKTNIYSITDVRTHEQDKEKLQEILRRMEKE